VAKVTASPLGYSESFFGKARCSQMPAAQIAQLERNIAKAAQVIKKTGGVTHELWKSGKLRKFKCELAQPRKLYDWSARGVSLRHDPKSKTAQVEMQMWGIKDPVKMGARVELTRDKRFVLYKWTHDLKAPKGRGFTEKEDITSQYTLQIHRKTGASSLQQSAFRYRRNSSSRVSARCK